MMTQNPTPKPAEYWQEKADIKKILIKYLEKWWIGLLGIVGGMLLGIVVYFIWHAVTDGIQYEAYSQFYLEFAADESGDAYQYYNGYTWNELMTTDLIADGTLQRLEGEDIDLSKLEADTEAEILSDIRVLRVTFSDQDPDVCASIQKATEGSLEDLGDTAKEFDSIKTIKSVEPYRVYADNRLKQAILLGGLIGLALVLIAGWIYSVLDDRVCVPSDIYDLNIAFLGVELKDQTTDKALRLHRMHETVEEDVLADNEDELKNGSDENVNTASYIDVCEFLKSDDMSLKVSRLKKSGGVILEVPYNKVRKTMLALLIKCLKQNGCRLLGIVITGADNRFYNMYM